MIGRGISNHMLSFTCSMKLKMIQKKKVWLEVKQLTLVLVTRMSHRGVKITGRDGEKIFNGSLVDKINAGRKVTEYVGLEQKMLVME